MKKKKSGFSLIEILTVVAIIAILAGILYPVFAQAKKSAINATNFSNINQINKGLIHYSQDYDKMTPPANSVASADPDDLIDHRISHYNALLVPYLARAWETWYDPFRNEICEGYGPGGNEPGNKLCHGYGLNIGIHAADGLTWGDKKDGLYDVPVQYAVNERAWVTLYPGRTTEYYEKPDEFVVHQTSNDAPWWEPGYGSSEWITNAIEYQNCPGGVSVQNFELPLRASGRWIVGLLSGAAKMVPHERYRAPGFPHLIMPVKESDFLQRCNSPKDTVGGPAPNTTCQDRIRWFIQNRTKF